MRARVIPVSLHNRYIPLLKRSIGYHNETYAMLKRNDPPLEKNAKELGFEELTKDNWKELLIPNKSIVCVPISHDGIHWHISKQYGHDRVLEILYTGYNKFTTSIDKQDIQLNFKHTAGIVTAGEYTDFACKVSGLDEYVNKMYVKLTEEQAIRLRRLDRRFQLLGWRRSIEERAKELTAEIIKENPELDKAQRSHVYHYVKKALPGIVIPESKE